MKILLFGNVRTRSSYLLDVACNAYNSVNLFEDYLEIDQRKIHQTYLKKDPIKLWTEYQNKFNDLTTKYFTTHKSFGIKIFPLSYYNLFKSLPVITKEPNFVLTSNEVHIISPSAYLGFGCFLSQHTQPREGFKKSVK